MHIAPVALTPLQKLDIVLVIAAAQLKLVPTVVAVQLRFMLESADACDSNADAGLKLVPAAADSHLNYVCNGLCRLVHWWRWASYARPTDM